ncbi:ABC-type spermidine/putrescine transport system, ATPase component [Caldisphaera lagunensis DSM 15908]|uniref:Molybdate/tungstate import ATP-binding protein WtpC n=1 Tax=Caldisphaera lagunensis (strain DSM 15908 / JCM 11604 / ANMR 0165 / IC-154) TaxID=1056495 RepID=L0AB80_CALLD|nr:ATP-binding cassette domain-containing protein [Caldisphaera lagunensis]AFZ71148.1 ABC-type spermidine/putrescine transport system, ATPase component [Caldisphaera lagunensis DSM 15908]
MKALSIRNLVTKVNTFTLGPINLDVDANEYYIISGPNGSGKTTLLKTILGFYRPLSGKIMLYDKDITYMPIEKRRIGYVTQNYSLFNNMDVKANIEYGLKMLKLNKQERERKVKEIASTLKIENLLNKKPKELSMGQQQLVSIARALVIEPKVLLLDEPLSNLDPNVKRNLREILRIIVRSKTTTIIHISHFIEDAFELSTKMGFMYKGKIIEEGDPIEMINNPKTKEFSEYLGYSNIILLNNVDSEIKNILNEIDFRNDFIKDNYLVFRPEDAIICKNKCCKNSLEGEIEEINITERGFNYKVKTKSHDFVIFSKDIFKENDIVNICIDAKRLKIVKSVEEI